MAENQAGDFYSFDEEYRDHLATVDAQGNRIWIYPKKPRGTYHNYRIVVTIVLLGLLLSGPFIKIGGQPLLLFNVFERKFVFFGIPFWPQDIYLFAIATITFFVFVILFTVAFGRVWCGWACPQTLFMEMVFRKIEYLIEGDANQQRRLDMAPWGVDKIIKKGGKHLIFILFSLVISHTVLAYLVGVDEALALVQQPPSENISGFVGLMFFTGIFYWVFAYFREQACTVVCPYGRLQGVLLNKESIVVGYDHKRGEPRGKLKKGEVQSSHGDCIDCKLCVHACPTGIDIRNGTQLECVNCTACIDACDEVMEKIERPKGLIRYTSFNAIEQGVLQIFTARVKGYSVILVILVSLLGYLLATRSDVEATVLRVPGQLYQRTDDGKIQNLYNIQLINKTFETRDLEVRVKDGKGELSRVGGDNFITLEENGSFKGVFFVRMDPGELRGYKTKFEIEVVYGGEVIEDVSTSFLGPGSTSL